MTRLVTMPALVPAVGPGERCSLVLPARWALACIPYPVARCRSDRTLATGAARPNWQQQEEALGVDVENLLAKAADNLSVRRAFGTAYEKDGISSSRSRSSPSAITPRPDGAQGPDGARASHVQWSG